MQELAGKAALVTGAGSGIGRALVLDLARNGMRVGALDIDGPAAAQVASEARALGAEAWSAACDVSDPAAVNEALSGAAKALGAIAVLCANAGVTAFERFAGMSDADVDWIYAVNFLGVSRLVKAVLPQMIAARDGHIVVTSSMAGLVPTWAPIHVPYVATKSALIGMTMNLRAEIAEHGVGCTVVCPGGVATRIMDSPQRRPERFGGASAGQIQPPKGFTPGSGPRSMRTPEQVADMVEKAIRRNQPLVVTDSTMRELFEGYAASVLEAFDRAAEWEAQA